jgi:predicted transcriptional regulator
MNTGRRLSTEEKMEIFSHLVATQDAGESVRKSYETTTEHFSISEEQLKTIEKEGLDNEWPPLSEPVSAH